ncbi:MAG: TonB-dependent receptor [Gammaproteobacteria bacterium]|nr:MAG: TonB-dependent receptor [Gammaproteobacteria bacterium]
MFDPTIPAPPQGFCQLQNAVPSGSELPGTPKFKGNLTARYTFGLHQFDAHVQGSFVYQSDSTSALAPSWAALIGNQPAYGIADFFAGVEHRYSECPTFSPLVQGTPTTIGAALCGSRPHVGINTPRTIGVRFGQRF